MGQTVNYTLVVMNMPGSGHESTPDSVMVTDLIPLGLKDVQVQGNGWSVSESDKISPMLITASYIRSNAVQSGSVLERSVIQAYKSVFVKTHQASSA